MHSTESLVDDDVTGDDSYGSMAFAFGEDASDQLRLSYMEDVYEDSDDTLSAWKLYVGFHENNHPTYSDEVFSICPQAAAFNENS